MAEVSEVTGPQLCSPHAAVANSTPRRTAEPPLDILAVATLKPDPTWLVNPNRNLGDARLIILFYMLLSFIF